MTLILGTVVSDGVVVVSDGLAMNISGKIISEKFFKSYTLDGRIIIGVSTNGLTVDSINQFLSTIQQACRQREKLIYPDIAKTIGDLANSTFPNSDHLLIVAGCDEKPHLYKLDGKEKYSPETVDGVVAIGHTKGHDFQTAASTSIEDARNKLTELMINVMQVDKRIGGQLQASMLTTSGEAYNQIFNP